MIEVLKWLNRKRRRGLIFFGATETKFEKMCRLNQGPGIVGTKSQQCKVDRDLQYDHLHLPTNLKVDAARAEADGTLDRNPGLRKYLTKALAKMKGREEAWPHIDYQKEGHPSTLAHRKDLLPKV